jgi:hypothetical protein
MARTLLLFMLLLHMTGDFYIQTDAMAEKKKTSYQAVLYHCLLYAVPLTGMAILWSVQALILAAVLWVLHFIIDTMKYAYLKTHAGHSEPIVYCVDQFLHAVSIFVAVLLVKSFAVPFAFPAWMDRMLASLSISSLTALKWLLMIAIIWRPANVTIKTLILKYKPGEYRIGSSQENAGAFIGTLERLIIALLLSVNQYAAIGLVLAAKSIARYERMVKEQSFAEYYLLGTLLSTLIVIAAYIILFVLI